MATPHPDLSQYYDQAVDYRQAEIGWALDAKWTPKSKTSLIKVLSGSDREVLQVMTTASELTARVKGDTWTMPYSGGDVRMIIDGPVAELSTADGLLGCAIEPSSERLTVDAGSAPIIIRPLSC